MRFFRLQLSIFFAFCLVGCENYHSKPLNNAIIDQFIQSPNRDNLAKKSLTFKHPRIASVPIDFSKPLTAAELAIIAVLVNPDLKALRAKKGVTKAQVFDAGLLPDPQFNGNYTPNITQGPGLSPAYSSILSWDIGGLVTRYSRVKAAKEKHQQTQYDVAWQEWQTANQAQLLATRTHFLEQQQQLIHESLSNTKKLLDKILVNLKRHDAKIDQFGIQQTAYLNLQDQAYTLEKSLFNTQLQLNKTLGVPPQEKLPIAINTIEIPDTLNEHELYEIALESRLDLFALQAGYKSSETQLYAAILGQFPRFNINITQMTDNTNVLAVGPGAAFDIPILNRNQGAIAIAKATREQLYLEYAARLHLVRANIANIITDLRRTKDEIAVLTQELPIIRKSEKIMRIGLDEGNITQINYEDVRASLLDKELKLIALKQNVAEQMIALQIELGRYL